MDESLVDIVLILLAALVAVAVIPTFDVEPPTSTEINDSEIQLKPLQIAIDDSGAFLYADGSSDNNVVSLSAQELYDLVYDTNPNRTIEFTADRMAPANILVEANRIVQEVGRNAVFLVVVDS
ncbi:MAG: hypothetical protein F4246_07540 [Rhodothermaceae bacterium]|nr:hypothetical protein [Rhodothermaceae bacterium]MYD20091.1 hypothetical protein [Rhodothermaceae bacterium]MYD56849.1 hypothetical protein [Rhodothermaceae bacterium]MYI43439.1 hypothetical protein [Rhodothermaceae bacterium]MYJ56099.1 hypothetical protein [Rhodothermaceae bacterium]